MGSLNRWVGVMFKSGCSYYIDVLCKRHQGRAGPLRRNYYEAVKSGYNNKIRCTLMMQRLYRGFKLGRVCESDD